MGGVFPARARACDGGILLGHGTGVQKRLFGEVEEGLFGEEVEALVFHFGFGGGVGGEEADAVDGADGEDGGGETQGVAVLAEGFKEGVGGVVVALAGVLNGGEEGAGEEEEV